MRESRPKAARGAVNLDVAAVSNAQETSSSTAIGASTTAGNGRDGHGDGNKTLNTQDFERQRLQFLEEDSQIDEEYANSPIPPGFQDQATDYQSPYSQLPLPAKKDTPHSQLAAPTGPLVSETQLQGLFDDTQFDKGFTKPAKPVGEKGKGNVHGHLSQSQSQDTQFFDEWKNKLAEEESQIENQSEPVVKEVQRQGWTFMGVDKEGTSERGLVKEPERRRADTQADESQFVVGLRAQLLDSQIEACQGDTTNLESQSAQEKTVLTETSESTRGAETQGSDQVVLFPLGTSFGAGQGQGQIELYSQSQSQSQNAELNVLSDTSESQDRASQVLSRTHVDRQPGSGPSNLDSTSAKPSTSHNQPQSHNTTTNASAQGKEPKDLVAAASSTSNKRRRSEENIAKLKGRAMDDWQRDSLGMASQTQENESGPRYGLGAKSHSQGGEAITKKNRRSDTQSGSGGSGASRGLGGGHLDIDRTYNENESGAVRLGLTQSQSQISQSQNLAVSQDQGMRSPSYDFARQSRAVDDTSQLEPETPATTKKNPFGKTSTGVPMGMSQVFAATQSSPLDPRFVLPSDGLRPSSPGIGLPSSPIARRDVLLEKDSQEVEASSPSYINLAVASSFHPFDESTQPEAIRKANAQRAKSSTPVRTEIPEHVRRDVAEKYKDRVDAAEIRESQEERKRIRKAEEEARIAEAKRQARLNDDGMDIEKENRIRIARKRQEEAIERNLREVSDMMAPRKEKKPELDRVRRAASSGRDIKKNPIRENRLKRQSEERSSPPKGQAAQNKRAEEVEVPASGEAAKAKEKSPPKKKSRHSRTPSEEYRAQSEGTDARDTQGTESQVIRSSQAPRSSAAPSSQQEVVVDSQNNISTQAMTDHNSLSLEEVQDSYQPPSSRRPKSKLNCTSSALLPTLGKEDSGLLVLQNTSPPAGSVSVPVTSSALYLKNPTTPGGTKSSNETAPEVVPETSPASKTPSPEKLPFGDLDMVHDTPMPSFSDMRMTQEAPSERDPSGITPTKFVKRTYGKKTPVKKRPEQIGPGKGVRINFSEVPSDEEVDTRSRRKKSPHPGHMLAKSKEPRKSARFILEDDNEEDDEDASPVPRKTTRGKGKQVEEQKIMMPVARMSATLVDEDDEAEASPSPVPRRSSRAKGKQAEAPQTKPAAKAPEPPVEDNDDVNGNADALATLHQMGRPTRKAKKSIPYKPAAKPLVPVADASSQSSPIRAAVPQGRRSARCQPSDLKNQAGPVTAPATSEDPDDSDDDAPIARAPLSKRRIDNTVLNTSDTELANTSPVKSNKLASTPPFLAPLDDTDDEDDSVSPIRPSIEDAPKITVCAKYLHGRPCNKDHSKDGFTHDPVMKALSAKRRGATNIQSSQNQSNIPSTASPGKSPSPAATDGRDSRLVSAFARPDLTAEAHLPPTATDGRTHKSSQAQAPAPLAEAQTNSEYATAQSSLPIRRFSVESSPLSDLNSDLAEELEEFHTAAQTAKAGTSTQASRESTAMSDAALMPPPQTVSRQLDFVPPVPLVETPALPATGKNKRTASSSGGKGKKAAKTTPNDTPSRSRRATRSSSAVAASGDDEQDGDETLVVRDTPRVTPTRRAIRQASRPSYAESSSTDGDDITATAGPATATRRQPSRTPTPVVEEEDEDTQPAKTKSSLFRGMAFAVSYKSSHAEAVQDREEITTLILDNGGELIEDFKDLFEKTGTDSIATPAVSRAPCTTTSFATGSRRGSAQPVPPPQQGDDEETGTDLKLTEHAKELGFVAFIGDTYSRKSKFLQALSLFLPCLHSAWIRDCVRTKSIVRWISPYMLAAGESRKLGGMPCSRELQGYSAITARFEDTFANRKKMLAGKGVLFLFPKSGRGQAGRDNKVKREHYLWLTRALGARAVRRVQTAGEARNLVYGQQGEGMGWDIVYVDDGEKVGSVRREVEKRQVGAVAEREEARTRGIGARGKKVRVVSDEFVVQSLILGCLEDEDLKDENAEEQVDDGDVEMDDAEQDEDEE